MSIQEELGRSLKKQAIKTGVKEGLKRVKNPKIKKGISSFLKILASLAILRSLLSMFGVDFGSDDDLDIGETDDFNMDMDGDGIADSMGYDVDGDGLIDSVSIDTDGDGIVDTIQMDTDGDGIIDKEIIDMDGDGQFGSMEDELERDYLKKSFPKNK